jgi:N-glycosylase/DNA lyase
MVKKSLTDNTKHIIELKDQYNKLKPKIEKRLADFKDIWQNGSEYDIYCELIFCLFTPQSKAIVCDDAVTKLQEKGLLLDGTEEQLGKELNTVRFRYTKAKNVVDSRRIFFKDGEISIKPIIKQFKDPFKARSWLVKNIRGMGYKEASHFLRNIGMGDCIAILDRHILKNLVLLGVIDDLPKSLSTRRYLEIEQELLNFSEKNKIPPDHLDLLLWYRETGNIFK